jgi:cell wall assembly regulator SMI1
MKFLDVGSQLTNESIARFESELEIELPQDYKRFLLENNGGEPQGNWAFDFFEFNVPDKTSSIIRYFYKVFDNQTHEVDDLKSIYKALVGSGQILKKYLPIAEDPFGNIIFLGVDKKNFDNVVFGNAELEDPETGYLVMSIISNNFSEFLNSLYLIEDQ